MALLPGRGEAGRSHLRRKKGGIEMPTYEYECKDCKKKFTVILSLSEHDKTRVSCPKCKGKKVVQNISSFMTKTSRKS